MQREFGSKFLACLKGTLNMKRMKYTKFAAGCITVLCIGCQLLSGCAKDSVSLDQDLEQHAGVSEKQLKENVMSMFSERCILASDELDFYRALYKKEYGKAQESVIEKEELTEFISKYYAEFYLANYYGISEPFSFEWLKDMWTAENQSRQEMKKNGEIFYGPVEYEFVDYFGYLYSNLKIKNVEAIVADADEALINAGKEYYEEHSETYDDLMGAVCRLSDGERTEERTFSYDDIQSLYKTNEAVLNFIMDSEIGDTMQYPNGDKIVTVELLAKEIDHRAFEDMQGVIMNDYVQREFYDAFVEELTEEIVKGGLISY